MTHVQDPLSWSNIAADDPNVPPVLIARLGKGQEIRARCIAKKVFPEYASSLEMLLYLVSRVLRRNMLNGHHAPPFRSSTTRTTSFAIRRTGMKRILRRNGRSARTQRKRNLHEKMNRLTTWRNQTSSTWKSRPTVAWVPKKLS